MVTSASNSTINNLYLNFFCYIFIGSFYFYIFVGSLYLNIMYFKLLMNQGRYQQKVIPEKGKGKDSLLDEVMTVN